MKIIIVTGNAHNGPAANQNAILYGSPEIKAASLKAGRGARQEVDELYYVIAEAHGDRVDRAAIANAQDQAAWIVDAKDRDKAKKGIVRELTNLFGMTAYFPRAQSAFRLTPLFL